MSKRQCTGTNRHGNPCQANPLKDRATCIAHTEELGSFRFGSPAQARAAGQLGGRPALPKPTDVARELVERHVYAVLRPHFKALGLELEDDGSVTPMSHGAIITGESKDGEVIASDIEDLGAQIAAAEKLLDRVYGRPKQSTELSGPAGQPVQVSLPTESDWHAQVARVLGEVGAIGVPPVGLINGNGHANGNGNGNGHRPDQN